MLGKHVLGHAAVAVASAAAPVRCAAVACRTRAAANEENSALRKAIEDADYEYCVGLLRLNQLDLVTVVASPATVPKKRNCAVCLHHRSNSSRNLDLHNAFASPVYSSRRGATVPSALSVDNDSARQWTTTRWR